ncbi:4'-phosphopantetheinyl transferase family protein [Clostridium omnivorum]|uniref:4'-phosphopantetheinyl transferase n=1 Tax=Clostridium omnivorum TaxID=1604902 RepID=A0ABQ5N7X2_9CLOT|nr:4'-phosphopantetheinyl transferase superfamily protein [Clostridium sp. E14]GLC31301.1 4'-phosphopantetheinyl transferase [Clostridium sp. E14]
MEIYAVKIMDISEEFIEKISFFISEDKRFKINRFINRQDKIRTLIGDVLVRFTAMEKLKINNDSITFNKNDYGKPFLKDYPKFKFNISHSGDFLVCAFDDTEIGIDIEQINQIDYREIANSFFSESEVDYILDKDSNDALSRFYDIWTLKESYVKCCGLGVTMPLESFSICINEHDNIGVVANNHWKSYSFKRFDISEGYKMSVCSVNKEISEEITFIDQNTLIEDFIFQNSIT